MAKVEIYTTTTCPFCVAAKTLLKGKGVAFEEIDVTDPNLREGMIKRASGRRTVPQIFINDVGVGGADDLMKLNKEGKLEALLA
jgi:glutaredoxin 3